MQPLTLYIIYLHSCVPMVYATGATRFLCVRTTVGAFARNGEGIGKEAMLLGARLSRTPHPEALQLYPSQRRYCSGGGLGGIRWLKTVGATYHLIIRGRE